MLTIHVWPKWLKEFLLTHPLYKSPKKTSSLPELKNILFQKRWVPTARPSAAAWFGLWKPKERRFT